MKKNYKKLISIVISLMLFFPSLGGASVLASEESEVKSPTASDILYNNWLPAFKYDRYNIEPNTRAAVDLLLQPDAKVVKVEVINAEDIGTGLDEEVLSARGLKIYKNKRLRTKESTSELLKEDIISVNFAIFNLLKLSNRQQTVDFGNYKVFKIYLNGLPSAIYTLKATVDEKYITETKIYTKPDFRIDDVSPPIIDVGLESVLTIEGKNLDSLTSVNLSGEGIEVREVESLDEGILKVKVLVSENAPIGFRNIAVSHPLLEKSATLINGVYVGPRVGIDGKDGKDGIDGKDGVDGKDGIDGMGICADPTQTLMILANNLPYGSSATAHFDYVSCNATFGIPVGRNGQDGIGVNGRDGSNICTDRNATLAISSITLSASSPSTSTFDPSACTLVVGTPQGATGVTGATGATGATGTTGLAGINCWDLNADRVNDLSEDVNKDGVFDAKDCQKKDKDKD